MKIQVKIKNVYGKELVYPVCEKATLFAAIAMNKTLTPDVISCIKALGYDIEQVVPAGTGLNTGIPARVVSL